MGESGRRGRWSGRASLLAVFGIWYYANDIIRGADLAPLVRYQPGPEGLPAIYQRSRR